MTLTASRVADELDRTARLLEAHGADTTRRVHDLALGAGGSSGPGQRNAVSDPTGSAAIAPPDRLAGLEHRWTAALARLRTEAYALDVINNRPEAHAHGLASLLRTPGSQEPKAVLSRLHSLSLEIDHIIYECIPLDREQADEELREKAHALVEAECCQACESPTGPSTKAGIPDTRIVSGLCRPGCYDTERRQVQRGEWEDRAAFIAYAKANVARGDLVRPASPLWRTAVPTIHEGDPAA